MKKLYATIACAVIIAAVILSNPKQGFTDDTVPQAGKTGAPGEGTCAVSGCHGGSGGGTGNVAISFSGGNTYAPGNTYSITVTVTDAAASRFGFELTALDATDAKAGNLVITNATTQSMPTSGAVPGRQYIAHKNANSSNTWTFDWEAPATSVGDITFYYSGNGANGNGNATGDKIYLGSTTISVITSASTANNPADMFNVQNPVADKLEISYSVEQPSYVTAELFDATGRKVMDLSQRHVNAGSHQLVVPINSNVPAGLYFVRLNVNNKSQTSKVIVL